MVGHGPGDMLGHSEAFETMEQCTVVGSGVNETYSSIIKGKRVTGKGHERRIDVMSPLQ